MKNLVLLYCDDKQQEITIREFLDVKESHFYYLTDKNQGIMKKCIGNVCKVNCCEATLNKTYLPKYPIDIPYMHSCYWDGYFLFVNKNNYDKDPKYYYNMIKNYRED